MPHNSPEVLTASRTCGKRADVREGVAHGCKPQQNDREEPGSNLQRVDRHGFNGLEGEPRMSGSGSDNLLGDDEYREG